LLLFNLSFNLINKYNLSDNFNKLNTSEIPEIKFLIKNLISDKKEYLKEKDLLSLNQLEMQKSNYLMIKKY
tara:strand:+ start:23 stop:235 length:213 start_codon:yes stop_codon:yes gene_type:complete